MALQVEKGVFTCNTSSGNQTITLADSGITPKALILWASYDTAEGITNGDGVFSFGMGTRDGGSTQQQFLAILDVDAGTSSATVRSFDSNNILEGLRTDSATEATASDYQLQLVSFGAGQFVLNVANPPASAIKIHYMVLGGDDITAARVGEFTFGTAVATQDVTVDTGFGQPDLLIFAGCGTVNRFHQTDARFYLGFGKDNTERAAMGLHIEDASNAMSLSANLGTNRVIHINGTGTGIDGEADLSAKASWPTDGFQLSWTNQTSLAALCMYLALKGDFTATIGAAEMPTAGGNQDLALATGNPKGALFYSVEIPLTSGTQDTTHADLGGIVVGGMDGTHEGFAGLVQDDGNADSRASRFHSESKALARHIADAAGGAASLDAEADSSFSGTNVRLNWANAPALATDYIYLIFGEVAAGQEVSLPVATQPNAAQALDPDKYVTSPIASQLNTAQALKVPKLSPATQASVAQALNVDKFVTVPIASTANLAQALTATKTIFVTLPVASQPSSAVTLTAFKSIVITAAAQANTAQALSIAAGSQEFTLPIATQSNAAITLDADKHITLPFGTQQSLAQALDLDKIVNITIAVSLNSAGLLRVPRIVAATQPSAAQSLDADKHATLPIASQASSAQTQSVFKRAALPVATQPNLAVTFSATKFAGITPATSPQQARPLAAAKSIFIPTASSTNTARDLRIPKLVPAIQSNIAGTLSVGQITFVGITPATQSSSARPLVPYKQVVISFAVTPQAAQTLTARKFASLAFATSPQAAQALSAFKRAALAPAISVQTALNLIPAHAATIAPALQNSLAQTLSGHKRATLAPAIQANIAVAFPPITPIFLQFGATAVLTPSATGKATGTITATTGKAAGTVDEEADGSASATTGLQS